MYQMDTQTARYYFGSVIYNNDGGRAFSALESAHKLLIQVIIASGDKTTFKQVIKYRSLYETFSGRIIHFCREFSEICQSYLLTGQRSKDQRRIAEDAINSLSDLERRLIYDIGSSIGK